MMDEGIENRNIKNNYYVVSGKEQLHHFNEISQLRQTVWPDFIRLPDEVIFNIYEYYPDFQVSMFDCDTNELIGIANSIPIVWMKSLDELSDEGVSWIVDTGLKKQHEVNLANILCAISVTVKDSYRHQGVSKRLIEYLKRIASRKKIVSLIVPLRPTLKSLYPLIPIDQYIEWKNKEGFIFDPWLGMHIALGARVLKVCYRSACVTASIFQWEQWTGMHFPGDGEYILKQALVPVKIDHVNNQGTYIEPNVWVHYQIDPLKK